MKIFRGYASNYRGAASILTLGDSRKGKAFPHCAAASRIRLTSRSRIRLTSGKPHSTDFAQAHSTDFGQAAFD